MTLIINILFNLLYYGILIRVLLSWFPYRLDNTFTKFIYQITEPLLSPIRSLIPLRQSGIDFSPIILLLLLSLLKSQLLLLG